MLATKNQGAKGCGLIHARFALVGNYTTRRKIIFCLLSFLRVIKRIISYFLCLMDSEIRFFGGEEDGRGVFEKFNEYVWDE